MWNSGAWNQAAWNSAGAVNVIDLGAGLLAESDLSGQNITIRGYTASLEGVAVVNGVVGFNRQMSAGLIANATTKGKTRGIYSLSRTLRGFGFVRLVFDVNVPFSANLKGFGGLTGVFADAILSGSLAGEAGLSGTYQRVQRLAAQDLTGSASFTGGDIFITALMSAKLTGKAWANLALVGDPNANVWITARRLRATATITEAGEPWRVFKPNLTGTATLDGGFGRRRRIEALSLFCQARFTSVSPSAIFDARAMLEAGAALAADLAANLTLKPKQPNFQGNASFGATPSITRNIITGIEAGAELTGTEPIVNRGLSAWLEAEAGFTGTVGSFTQHPLSSVLTATANMQGQEIRLAEQFSGTLTAESTIVGTPVLILTYSANLMADAAKIGAFFVNPFISAPPGRIIDVLPKEREIPVLEKDRAILFFGDDQGLSMEQRVKQPREVVDYDIDMREWFDKLPGDSVASVDLFIDITGDPNDLELGPGALPEHVLLDPPNTRVVKVWIGGGRDGETYKVTAVVTTNSGRVEEVDFQVRVIEQ